MAFCHAATVHAGPIINTPTGLNPGDHFRIAFVTSGILNAVSTNIADYNTFVNAEAGGASYNGVTVQWFAIASTTATSAFDNIQSTTSAPVYLNDGTKIADSLSIAAGGLWSGSLYKPIDQTLGGVTPFDTLVWTGTTVSGQIEVTRELGGLSNKPARLGFLTETDSTWISGPAFVRIIAVSFYGISEELTVAAVPEPSTAALLGVALGGLIIAQARARRLKLGLRAQEP